MLKKDDFNALHILTKLIILQPIRALLIIPKGGGRRGRDRMVVGFTTTYAISAYHH